MNFLVHFYLDCDSPEAMVGSVMPDLCRGPMPADLPPAARRAFERHRVVDAFTDTHPVFACTRRRLQARHHHFSGILADVFYDHILASEWSRYHDEPLDDFIERVHGAIHHCRAILPVSMRRPAARLVEQNWLGRYATVEGIERTLGQMSVRLSERLNRAIDLAPAAYDLAEQHDAIAADFHAFFPLLCRFMARPCPATILIPAPARHPIRPPAPAPPSQVIALATGVPC